MGWFNLEGSMDPSNQASAHDATVQPNSAPAGVPAWAAGWLTAEELQWMSQDENPDGGLELKDFLPELEAIVKEQRHGE